MSTSGDYTGTTTRLYMVQIDSTGGIDTFKWSSDSACGITWTKSLVNITGSEQLLDNGVYVTFENVNGHEPYSIWKFTARAKNINSFILQFWK